MTCGIFLFLFLQCAILCTYSISLHDNCNLCEGDNRHILTTQQYISPDYKPPIVDVFLFVVTSDSSYYITSGQFWVIPHVIKEFSSRNTEQNQFDCRIHIVTDSDRIIAEGTEFGKPFYMYNLQSFDYITLPFKKLYAPTHNSVNSLEYEYLCFNRWRIMKEIVMTWNEKPQQSPITRILSLDLDVLMLQNVAKFVDSTIRALTFSAPSNLLTPDTAHTTTIDTDFDTIVLGLGAINIFSVRGLTAFADFVFGWFNRPLTDVMKANAPYGKFFSDMMIMKEFLLTTSPNATREFVRDKPIGLNASRLNGCFEFWRTGEYYSHWRADPANQCLLNRLRCVPMSGYREMKPWKNRLFFQYQDGDEAIHNLQEATAKATASAHRPIELRGTFEPSHPYCLMHFQGKEWKYLIPLYGQAVLALLDTLRNPTNNPTKNTTSTVFEHMPPMVIRKARSRDLYAVRGGVKRPIMSMAAYEHFNYTQYAVLAPPLELFDFYLNGPPIDL